MKAFNTTGLCIPTKHYMVDISERLQSMKAMVRGKAYRERGEEQLAEYLEYFHLQKGYMLSYNFNRNKEVGVKRISVGDKLLIEAVV